MEVLLWMSVLNLTGLLKCLDTNCGNTNHAKNYKHFLYKCKGLLNSEHV